MRRLQECGLATKKEIFRRLRQEMVDLPLKIAKMGLSC
jgi:hypothetical protein